MSYYVGIDPGSRSAGLAAIGESGELRHQTIHPTGEVPDRLVQLRVNARRWLAPIAEVGAWCVVVERPGTRYGGATLLAAYGVLVEAARSMLPCPVMTLASAEWKRLALGNGAAKKDDVMAAARERGLPDFAGQDAADALMCAIAARVLTETNLRSAA